MQLQNLLQTVVLPGLQLVPANVPVTMEVWRLLRQLPYRQRFCIYAKWQVQPLPIQPLPLWHQVSLGMLGQQDGRASKSELRCFLSCVLRTKGLSEQL